MGYLEKSLQRRPDTQAEAWDTARHMAPDPSWPADKQLRWYSRFSHILALNSSERCRVAAAGQADREVNS